MGRHGLGGAGGGDNASVRARAKSSRFCTPAHCLLSGSLTRGFASRLDAPFQSQIDRVILARALNVPESATAGPLVSTMDRVVDSALAAVRLPR